MYTVILAVVQHYLDYLRSPAVLLAILVVVGPISLEIFQNYKLTPLKSNAEIPGCFRLGITKKSNLDDQHLSSPDRTNRAEHARIKALFTYPVKSCRGVELAASEVGSTGLKYDRMFTFAQLLPKRGQRTSTRNGHDSVGTSCEPEYEWRFITQREFPCLASIETELHVPRPREGRRRKAGMHPTNDPVDTDSSSWSGNGGCLILRFPFRPAFNPFGLRTRTISIGLPLIPNSRRVADKHYVLESVSIWIDQMLAINVTDEIPLDELARIKSFLGVQNPLGLFRVDHNNKRAITRSLPKEREPEAYSVGFADAFPFHLLNMASVQAQDAELPTSSALKGRLDARRFRANVYITGTPAYDEDSWKKVKMGRCIGPSAKIAEKATSVTRHSGKTDGGRSIETDGEYHVACRTARCKLPNVDQESGVKDVSEPLTTLGRTRQVDRGAYPHAVLGIQMIPLFQQGILRVGDEVGVLERGEHVYEKMFA